MRTAFWILVMLALILLMSAQLFVFPTPDQAAASDAIVLYAGGRGERFRTALDLMEAGTAPVLVISHGRDWPEGRRVCDEEQVFEVICFRPQPDTTRGEASYLSQLVAERGWNEVVVVTSTYHVTRSRILTERCVDGRVRVVGADPELDPLNALRVVAREWVGMASLVVLERGC